MMGAISKYLGMVEVQSLFEKDQVKVALEKIADEILHKHSKKLDQVILVGIRTGGVYLAQRLQEILKVKTGCKVRMGIMDITLYRDDPFVGLPRAEVGSTELPHTLEGRRVILVDDVLFTGRTIRAALVELMDFGRPKRIELAVLVDRGHRELPIRADFVGFKVKTKRQQSVQVLLEEEGKKEDRVVLLNRSSEKK